MPDPYPAAIGAALNLAMGELPPVLEADLISFDLHRELNELDGVMFAETKAFVKGQTKEQENQP